MPSWLSIDAWGAFFLVLLVVAYLPLGMRLGRWLWNRDHYSFFPLALAASAVLIALAMKAPGRKASNAWLRRGLFAIAWGLLFVAVVLVSPWLSGVSAMFCLAAVIYTLGGWQVAKRALPAWLLLWLVIPIPLSLDRELIVYLQRVATRFSSGILDLMGFRHVVDGVVLRLPGQSYQVEEACSGIQSLFSALFCAGAYLILNRAGIVRSLLLLASTVFWVLIANVGRIVAVVYLKQVYALPVDKGFYHQLLGVIAFAFTMIAVFSTDRFFNFVWPSRRLPYWRKPESASQEQKASESKPSGTKTRKRTAKALQAAKPDLPTAKVSAAPAPAPQSRTRTAEPSDRQRTPKTLSSCWGRRELHVLVGGFALLALIEMTSIAVGGSMSTKRGGEIHVLTDDDATLIPETFHGWKNLGYEFVQRDHGHDSGEYSRVWTLSKGELSAEVSLDGPYTNGWHFLTDCYRGQGWDDRNIKYFAYKDIGESLGGDYMSFDVVRLPDQYGHVLTGLFDNDFRTFIAPQKARFQRHEGRINDLKLRVATLFGGGDLTVAKSDSLSFQIQVFCKSPTPLSKEDLAELENLYHEFRRQVTGQSKAAGDE